MENVQSEMEECSDILRSPISSSEKQDNARQHSTRYERLWQQSQTKLQEAEKVCEHLKDALAELHAKCEGLKQKVEQDNRMRRKLMENFEKIKKAIHAYEQGYKENESFFRSLVAKKDKLERSRNSLGIEVESWKDRNEAELLHLGDELAKTEAALREQKTKIEEGTMEMKSEVKKKDTDIEHFKEYIDELQNINDNLERDNETMTREKSELMCKNESLEKQMESLVGMLKKKTEAHEKEVRGLTKELEDGTRLKSMQLEIESLLERIDSEREKRRVHEIKTSELESCIDLMRSEEENLSAEKSQLQEMMAREAGESEEARKSLAESRTIQDDLSRECESLRKELADLEAARSETDAESKRRSESSARASEEYESNCRQKDGEIAKLRAKLQQMNEEHEADVQRSRSEMKSCEEEMRHVEEDRLRLDACLAESLQEKLQMEARLRTETDRLRRTYEDKVAILTDEWNARFRSAANAAAAYRKEVDEVRRKEAARHETEIARLEAELRSKRLKVLESVETEQAAESEKAEVGDAPVPAANREPQARTDFAAPSGLLPRTVRPPAVGWGDDSYSDSSCDSGFPMRTRLDLSHFGGPAKRKAESDAARHPRDEKVPKSMQHPPPKAKTARKPKRNK